MLLDRVNDILDFGDFVLETSFRVVLKLDLLVEFLQLLKRVLGNRTLADRLLIKTERTVVFGRLARPSGARSHHPFATRCLGLLLLVLVVFL